MERYVVKVKASISKDLGFETHKNVLYTIEKGWMIISYLNGTTIHFNLDKIYAYQIIKFVEEKEEVSPWA